MGLYYQCKGCKNKIYLASLLQGVLVNIDGLEIACENCGAAYTIYVKSSDDNDDDNDNNGYGYSAKIRVKEDGGYIVPDPNYIERILENKAALSRGLRKGIKKSSKRIGRNKGGLRSGFETE